MSTPLVYTEDDDRKLDKKINNLECQTNDLRYYTYLRFGYF